MSLVLPRFVRRLGRRGNRTALLMVTTTVVFAAVVVYSLVLPPLRTHQERQRFTRAAEQALPLGTVRTSSGVGGGGSFTGVASGFLAAPPAAVLATPRVDPGSFGWTPIPDCGATLACFASAGKDYVLTLTVTPCIARGCPAGGSQVDAEVSRGGPNS